MIILFCNFTELRWIHLTVKSVWHLYLNFPKVYQNLLTKCNKMHLHVDLPLFISFECTQINNSYL